MAGELGHATVGHAESIAGADGIEKAFAALGTSGELSALWCKRDRPPYRAVWNGALDALAMTVATTVHFFDPRCVVIGGGLSRGEGFIDEIRHAVTEYLSDPFKAILDLRPSLLGNGAVVIGASALVKGSSIF